MVKLTPEELLATSTFPTINSDWISERIESVQIQREMIPENESSDETEVEKVVPTIQATSGQGDLSSLIISNSARRLEVMKNCVSYIFENRISDARKTFPARFESAQKQLGSACTCAGIKCLCDGKQVTTYP